MFLLDFDIFAMFCYVFLRVFILVTRSALHTFWVDVSTPRRTALHRTDRDRQAETDQYRNIAKHSKTYQNA